VTALGSFVFGFAGLWIAWQLFAASGGPTAQSVALGLGAFVALLGVVGGALVGRALSRAREPKEAARARLIALVALLGAGWLGWRAYAGRRAADALAAIRKQPLSLDEARRLARGSIEVQRAVAYNRSCPSEVLGELAKSPDEAVRASVAGNPSSPRAALDELANDQSELVKLYLSLNPARVAR